MNEQAIRQAQHHAETHAELRFGCPVAGWGGLEVVRFSSVEAISECFRFEITLLRRNALEPLDLDAVVDDAGSLAIATEGSWRIVHGLVAEIALLQHTPTLQLYRVLLVPPLWRARHRRRCRCFVDKSIQHVVDTVLGNQSLDGKSTEPGGLERFDREPSVPEGRPRFDGVYGDPAGFYRWQLLHDKRLTDPKTRPLIVQYNESDYDFVRRLLADEGVSFFFEELEEGVLMSITDAPQRVSTLAEKRAYPLRSHREAITPDQREVVLHMSASRRMIPGSVTVRDFVWKRSHQIVEQEAVNPNIAPSSYFIFPGRDEHTKKPGWDPATVHAQRFETERLETRGRSTARRVEPGHRFVLQDAEHLHGDHEYLAVAVETHASQLDLPGTVLDEETFARAPSYTNRLTVVPVAAPYRPPLTPAAPRIAGVQSATVTADEADDKEISADEHGRVRLRFAWDQRPADGTPSSTWIRVSQAWAGAGWGALHIPRVGQEVLVAFRDGDPERPMIVGRAYNAQHPPPYGPDKEPEISGIKSHSSPDADVGHNEIRMQDKKGQEELYIHAQRASRRVVGAAETISVGGAQKVNIGKQWEVQSKEKQWLATPTSIKLEAGMASLEMKSGLVHLSNGAGASITLTGDQVVIRADKSIKSVAQVNVTLDSRGDLLATSKGTAKFHADTVLTIDADEALQLKTDGIAELDSMLAKLNG